MQEQAGLPPSHQVEDPPAAEHQEMPEIYSSADFADYADSE
jgi:hypothetical protein